MIENDDDIFCLEWHDCAECSSCDGFNTKCSEYQSKETRTGELQKLLNSFRKKL